MANIFVVNYLTKGTKITLIRLFKGVDVHECDKYLARFTKNQQRKLAQYIESCDKLPLEIEYRNYFYENIGWSEVIDEIALKRYILGLQNSGYEVTERDWTGENKNGISN